MITPLNSDVLDWKEFFRMKWATLKWYLSTSFGRRSVIKNITVVEGNLRFSQQKKGLLLKNIHLNKGTTITLV